LEVILSNPTEKGTSQNTWTELCICPNIPGQIDNRSGGVMNFYPALLISMGLMFGAAHSTYADCVQD
jgi:hypothetical protein